MKKYEIYQVGKVQPLTVEAEKFVVRYEDINRLVFYDDKNNFVAAFNFDNIAGFRVVSENIETLIKIANIETLIEIKNRIDKYFKSFGKL